MGLRQVVGYAAHGILAVYWLWTVSSTAPQLRKGVRGRGVRARVLLIKTAGLLVTAIVVGVVHYWATHWWDVAICLPLAVIAGLLLRRAYRRTVAAPRHRLTFARRARTLDVLPRHRSGVRPAHLRDGGPAGQPDVGITLVT